MTGTRFILIWVGLGLGSSAPGLAQEPPPPLPEPGETIRVRVATRGLFQGDIISLRPDTVVLLRGSREYVLGRRSITDVWTREPAYRAGARAGAIGGGVLFGLATAALTVGLCDAAECRVDFGVTLLGAGVGVLMGAVTGAVLGTFGNEWVRRYP